MIQKKNIKKKKKKACIHAKKYLKCERDAIRWNDVLRPLTNIPWIFIYTFRIYFRSFPKIKQNDLILFAKQPREAIHSGRSRDTKGKGYNSSMVMPTIELVVWIMMIYPLGPVPLAFLTFFLTVTVRTSDGHHAHVNKRKHMILWQSTDFTRSYSTRIHMFSFTYVFI